MSTLGYIANCLIALILIVGGYQFYFFVQRWQLREPREFRMSVDELIPFRPGWVWVYSGLYYPVIFLLIFTVHSFAQFNYTAFSFITLLAMQVISFIVFPVQIPAHWREYDAAASLSTRFLSLVHRYDGLVNSIPSMHVSVSTLTALHLFANLSPTIGYYALLCFMFPALIAASAVFTKQHYFVDLMPGAILGYLNYRIYALYVLP